MIKMINFVMRIKTFAALLFAGMMCLYMIGGVFISYVLKLPFTFAIPFIFIIQGLILSAFISVLWGIFFSGEYIRKLRYFARLIIFSLLLLALLAVCFSIFFAIPTVWAKLWWVVAGCIEAGVAVLSIIAELYYRATGKRYTEILNNFKAAL